MEKIINTAATVDTPAIIFIKYSHTDMRPACYFNRHGL